MATPEAIVLIQSDHAQVSYYMRVNELPEGKNIVTRIINDARKEPKRKDSPVDYEQELPAKKKLKTRLLAAPKLPDSDSDSDVDENSGDGNGTWRERIAKANLVENGNIKKAWEYTSPINGAKCDLPEYNGSYYISIGECKKFVKHAITMEDILAKYENELGKNDKIIRYKYESKVGSPRILICIDILESFIPSHKTQAIRIIRIMCEFMNSDDEMDLTTISSSSSSNSSSNSGGSATAPKNKREEEPSLLPDNPLGF